MPKGGCNFRRSLSARILIGTGGESGDCCRPPRGICPPDLTFWRNVAKLRFACFLCRAKCLFVCLFCTCLWPSRLQREVHKGVWGTALAHQFVCLSATFIRGSDFAVPRPLPGGVRTNRVLGRGTLRVRDEPNNTGKNSPGGLEGPGSSWRQLISFHFRKCTRALLACVSVTEVRRAERKMQKAMIGQNGGARAFFSFPSFSSRGFCRRGKCAHKCRTACCACHFFCMPSKGK